jgi:hypothetical protein
MQPSTGSGQAWEKGSRYFPVPLDGLLAVPEGRLRLFLISATLGRWVRSDGTYDAPSSKQTLIASVLSRERQERACERAGVAWDPIWRRSLSAWIDADMAHRCARGEKVTLFARPLADVETCPGCGGERTPTVRPNGLQQSEARTPTVRKVPSFRRSEPQQEVSIRGGSEGSGVQAPEESSESSSQTRRDRENEAWPEPEGGWISAWDIPLQESA